MLFNFLIFIEICTTYTETPLIASSFCTNLLFSACKSSAPLLVDGDGVAVDGDGDAVDADEAAVDGEDAGAPVV